MKEIELSAGIIEYEDTGGNGPVVVLMHGLSMDGSPRLPALRRLPFAFGWMTKRPIRHAVTDNWLPPADPARDPARSQEVSAVQRER